MGPREAGSQRERPSTPSTRRRLRDSLSFGDFRVHRPAGECACGNRRIRFDDDHATAPADASYPRRGRVGADLSHLERDPRVRIFDGIDWFWMPGLINGLASPTLTDSFDFSVAGNGDPGDVVGVEVTPSDGTLSGSTVNDEVTVAAVAPTVYASDLFSHPRQQLGQRRHGWRLHPAKQRRRLRRDRLGRHHHPGRGRDPLRAANRRQRARRGHLLPGRAQQGARRRGPVHLRCGSRVSAASEYRAKIRIANNGAVFVQASFVTGNVESPIGSEVQVSGLTASPGSFIWLRSQVTGSSPTTLRLRAWADGSSEPSTWQYTVTNATSGLQEAGAVGLRAYAGSAISNGPITLTFDDFRVTSIGGP